MTKGSKACELGYRGLAEVLKSVGGRDQNGEWSSVEDEERKVVEGKEGEEGMMDVRLARYMCQDPPDGFCRSRINWSAEAHRV